MTSLIEAKLLFVNSYHFLEHIFRTQIIKFELYIKKMNFWESGVKSYRF